MASTIRCLLALTVLLVVSACSDEPTSTLALAEETSTAPTELPSVESQGESLPDIRVIGETATQRGSWSTFDGVLGFANLDGELVHLYTEFGQLDRVALFPGSRGQDALVISQGPVVERVLIFQTAFIPESGWPEPIDFPLAGDGAPDSSFAFGANWGWHGDVFSANGSTSDDADFYVFNTETETVEPLSGLVGNRSTIDPDLRVDAVVPDGFASDSPDARVEIRRGPLERGPIFPEGTSSPVHQEETVAYIIGDDGVAGFSEVRWSFLTGDNDQHIVRQVITGPDDVGIEIKAFIAGGLRPGATLPLSVFEMVRLYE